MGEIEKSLLFQTCEQTVHHDQLPRLPKTPVDSEVVPTKLIKAELNRTFFGDFRVSSKCVGKKCVGIQCLSPLFVLFYKNALEKNALEYNVYHRCLCYFLTQAPMA